MCYSCMSIEGEMRKRRRRREIKGDRQGERERGMDEYAQDDELKEETQ